MIYEFVGPSGDTIRTTDAAEATELLNALEDHNFETFDPADNGADQTYVSPEDEEKNRCYTAWGYQ